MSESVLFAPVLKSSLTHFQPVPWVLGKFLLIFTNFGQLLYIYIQNERLFLNLNYISSTYAPHLHIYRVNELTHKYVHSIEDNLCRYIIYLLWDPRLPVEARMASIAVMLVESMVVAAPVTGCCPGYWLAPCCRGSGPPPTGGGSESTHTDTGPGEPQPPEPEPGDGGNTG